MTLDKFLNLAAIILGFIGTIFLLKGVLRMTPDVIGEIGQTRYDYSLPVLENLSVQKADTVTGFIVIVIAFSIQLVREVLSLGDIKLPINGIGSFLAILIVCSVLFGTFLLINIGLRAHNKLAAGKSITKWYITTRILSTPEQINVNKIKDVEGYSKSLLNLERKESESDEDYLIRLGDFLDMDIRSKVLPPNHGGQE